MSPFVSVDLNGWLDRLVDGDGEERILGFRSCLYRHEDMWLLGAQALAAARNARSDGALVDAMDALSCAAGQETRGPRPPAKRAALPAALWQLVADAARRTQRSAHLALVIPDGRHLGSVKVHEASGKTALETLHDTFERARPRSLGRSRIELVWRSVAALQAVMDRGRLGSEPGTVLVISVSRRTFWTVLELRPWFRCHEGNGRLCIVRRPAMEECKESEAWTTQRVECVRAALATQGCGDLDGMWRWTRWMEILATGARPESLEELGIDVSAIEHRSWPMPDDAWGVWSGEPLINWTKGRLPTLLVRRIEGFRNRKEGTPLAIVVENPVGLEMIAAFQGLVRRLAGDIPILVATGADTTRAAARLAERLGQDPEYPAWLDEVPAIELAIRRRTQDAAEGARIEWMQVVPGNEAIPAGETYHTRSDPDRRVTLAPGVEHIHLHLRRGAPGEWDERYSGRDTGHAVTPSDNVRVVEPLARVRPLSDEARIEIIEHLPDGRSEALAGARTGVRWSELSGEAPDALRSIPELYVFEASDTAWMDLKRLLQEVVESVRTKEDIDVELKDRLYKCTQKQWERRKFPLGSDGTPPFPSNSRQYRDSRTLLEASIGALHSDFERSVRSGRRLAVRAANRLHMPLTWLFTACPERTVEILLDAIKHPDSEAGVALHLEDRFSSWAVYSGIGRAVRSEESLRTIFDTLIGQWEKEGGERQDKFLLAAVTHPMARRVAVRKVLNENRERFERVKRFLDRHLSNVLQGIHDPLPLGHEPNIEFRYVTMGYRGLCQVRYANPDWWPVQGADAKDTFEKLGQASHVGGTFERDLVARSAPYLIGEGTDPSMPGGF